MLEQEQSLFYGGWEEHNVTKHLPRGSNKTLTTAMSAICGGQLLFGYPM